MEKWAQPPGDVNLRRASWSENELRFWDLRPSI